MTVSMIGLTCNFQELNAKLRDFKAAVEQRSLRLEAHLGGTEMRVNKLEDMYQRLHSSPEAVTEAMSISNGKYQKAATILGNIHSIGQELPDSSHWEPGGPPILCSCSWQRPAALAVETASATALSAALDESSRARLLSQSGPSTESVHRACQPCCQRVL